ncbi:3-oxoacyl-(acyl-carrier-protein) reductase [Lasallia pustulata]|uniref:3-oxoacyl-(Acyl-carrier-protein) reductase n=1 Tax=Lasallia pustulata TaxID=136370 RepID=A0A1W5DAS2_9LECA|nr:3-oxoacyl-(acyl-carrier-protein) reductase [Lasallia pustulata]
MVSTAKDRLQQVTSHLGDQTVSGSSHSIPKIRQVAGDSAGQRVKDKVIIITGTNSPIGIGRATAYQFAHNGARAIYMCDFISTHLSAYQAELSPLYPSVDIHTRQFDAADEPAVKAVVDEAIAKYGRLDIMFANAGILGANKIFTEIEADEFMAVMRTNVLSVFLAAKHAARAMQRTSAAKPHPGGSIIATASVAGLRSNAGGTDYSASKAAVISLMQSSCFQLAGTHIRCNAICPGLTETGMTRPAYEAARKRGSAARIGHLNPLRRGGLADEIARVALFLGSEDGSYVNGQAWAVDGGLSAGHPMVPGKMG